MAKTKKKEVLSLEEKLEQALVPVDEQPYEVPKNWCWVRLESVANLKSGTTLPSENEKEYGNIMYIKVADMNSVGNEQVIRYSERFVDEYDCSQIIPTGSVIFPKRGGAILTNKKRLIDTPLLADLNIMAVTPRFTCKYFYYWFLGIDLKTLNNGSNVPQINNKDIAPLCFPMAPRTEQQRIVEQIESLFVKLDEAKEKIQAVLAGYQSRKTMIIHKAFAGHYTKEWRKRNGCDIRDWKQITLNDVAEYKKGPFGSSITKAMFVPKASNTYKVYEQGNAIRKTLEYGSYYITEEKYKELKGFAVQPGDIIISCAGTIGEVYKLPEDCEAGVINQALMRVRIFDNIDEKFFIYYFGEVLKGDVNEQANGTAIKNIPPFKIMKAMEIKLPTLEEQQEIVAILDKVLESEKQSEDVLYLMIEQIDLMKKSILAKAFRGELDTNNPDEESAVKLLKQILEEV